MSSNAKVRWEGIVAVAAIIGLSVLAVAMVFNDFQCRSLYPVVAVVAGLGGYTLQAYRSK